MVHFQGQEYRSHTSCISEAQKYQGHLYREKDNKKGKGDRRKSINGQDNSQAMIPRGAYVEDAPDSQDMHAVAIVDVPPRAPTPPTAVEPEGLPENINVFDYLVEEATPNGKDGQRIIEHTTHYANGDLQYSQYSNGNGSQYLAHGYSYGNAAMTPGFERYDSYGQATDSQQSQAFLPPPYTTPAPKDRNKEKKDRRTVEKSDKKRKRGNVEDLDLSSSKRPVSRDEHMSDAHQMGSGGRVLHSGLTGGLSRLVTDPEFYEDRIDAGPTPISPLKRSKREADHDRSIKEERRKSHGSHVSHSSAKTVSSKHTTDKHRTHEKHQKSSRHRDSFSSDDGSRTTRKLYRALEYPDRPTSVQPAATNQLVTYSSRAELFMSFIDKGPESERGCSINKALKRYHRDQEVRNDEKEEVDKELFKSLRLRRNSRGEIVLFV